MTSLIAHISDPHLDGTARSAERLERVVTYLGTCTGVDAVLVTGDISDDGNADQYADVRRALVPLRTKVPVLACPGNHDDRTEFRRILLDEDPPASGPVDQVVGLADHRLFLCDSSVPDEDYGFLTDGTLERLDAHLSENASRPTLIALHHPPVELGIPAIDGIRLRNAHALAELIARHRPAVAAVLCGHAHTAATSLFADVPLACAGGIASTAVLPWEQTCFDSWADPSADPYVTFHVVSGSSLVSHVRTVALPGR